MEVYTKKKKKPGHDVSPTPLMATMHKLFFYGTLKRGYPNHWLLNDPNNGLAKFLGEAKLRRRHPLVVGPFNLPALLPVQNEGKEVNGELYELDSKMMKRIDELERHPDWYRRTQTQCVLQDSDEIVDCEVYFRHKDYTDLLQQPTITDYRLQT